MFNIPYSDSASSRVLRDGRIDLEECNIAFPHCSVLSIALPYGSRTCFTYRQHHTCNRAIKLSRLYAPLSYCFRRSAWNIWSCLKHFAKVKSHDVGSWLVIYNFGNTIQNNCRSSLQGREGWPIKVCTNVCRSPALVAFILAPSATDNLDSDDLPSAINGFSASLIVAQTSTTSFNKLNVIWVAIRYQR